MINIIQCSYLELGLQNNLNPIYSSLLNFKYINGYNSII
jgi:hypothetical protein